MIGGGTGEGGAYQARKKREVFHKADYNAMGGQRLLQYLELTRGFRIGRMRCSN